MYTLVLLRHGQSQWNLENRFTGWVDVPLTERGEKEAAEAGKRMKEAGIVIDEVHTNFLKRSIKTTWLALEAMDLMWTPIYKTWRLNERFYGALTGLNKSETAEKYGEEQVLIWRRSYDVPPPAMDPGDSQHPSHDPRYKDLNPEEIPATECVKDVIARVMPYWEQSIVPSIKAGKTVLVSASGNSLRAIVTHLDQLSPEEVVALNIPTGMPLVYELDENLKPIKHYYLATNEELEAAANEVKSQGQKQ